MTPWLAKAVMHAEIDKMTTRLWKETWNEVVGCRQTRHFFPTGPRPDFCKELIALPKIVLSQMIQILTGHTYLKRHQAIIDDSDRQRVIEALRTTDEDEYPNADKDGNAIIDAADPICSRCKEGDETPLHLLSECEALGTLRKDIFGREDLVGPGEVPDFTNLKIHQLISFFREAKFDTLTMHPFLAQYLPTDRAGNVDNEDMRLEKEEGFVRGRVWTSKYLFHIPTKQVRRIVDEIDEANESNVDDNASSQRMQHNQS